MSRFFQAIFTGIFITFIYDFFIFLGIKQGYIDYHNIAVYYNILFADHQNIYVVGSISVVLGLMIGYIKSVKFNLFIVVTLFLVSLSTLIPSVGYEAGKALLMKKNISIKEGKYTFSGIVYYDGRDEITFYDNRLKKTIILYKKDITQ